jgi:3-keto-5-aminohexanoate cleavage enzyme
MDKLIITVCATGAEVYKAQQPNLPCSPEEIAAEAVACREAGASLMHIHVRNEKGEPTQSGAIFAQTMDLIRSRSDVIIQASTGGATWMTAEERIQPLLCDPAPEMATLTTGTCNFGDGVFMNPLAMIETFAKKMQERGVIPEIEVFDAGFIETANRLIKKGLVPERLHYDFVMGVPGAIAGTQKNLLHLVELLPPGATWSVAGIGRAELPLAVMAIMLGGHVRVGFEDNIYYNRGVLAESNAQLVARVVRIARELGREIATPDEARQILRLKPRA